MKPPKLTVIKPRRLKPAQKELHAANNAFNVPELYGFFMVAWDKRGEAHVCMYSPDKTLDEILALCMMKITEANTDVSVELEDEL